MDVPAGRVVVGLRDLTGFDGRCDALYFCRNLRARPPNGGPRSRPWRKRLLGMPAEPPSAGSYDVVVVGGGIAGCSAALAAGRLGLRVALVQNRPVLGGNASSEIGITPRGETRSIVNEVSGRDRERVMRSERKIDLNLGWHVFSARRKGRRIVSVDAANIATGGEQRFTAKAFIDCTGVAAVGMLVGADTRLGREARAEFGEGLAPERADALHHGSTIIFSTKSTGVPTTFPDVPWATEVSRGYAGLGGQVTADHDNEGGLTHFWEYGQRMDPTRDAEDVRDHLLRAIYGTFATAKRTKPEAANLVLDRVGFVPAGGEARRLIGDYILTEKDIRSGRVFADAAAVCSGHFCLHYPGDQYDFRLGDWKWIPVPTYTVPLRCLYSRNVDNLLMAGKHISVTHIAASSTKTMLNGGQMGVAAGAAAFLCVRHGVTPRDVARRHVDELQDILVGRGPSGKALRDRLEGMTGNDDATP